MVLDLIYKKSKKKVRVRNLCWHPPIIYYTIVVSKLRFRSHDLLAFVQKGEVQLIS